MTRPRQSAEGGQGLARPPASYVWQGAAENKVVFLGYASQDAPAVERIAEALRASGVEVWFDPNELVGGDAMIRLGRARGGLPACLQIRKRFLFGK